MYSNNCEGALWSLICIDCVMAFWSPERLLVLQGLPNLKLLQWKLITRNKVKSPGFSKFQYKSMTNCIKNWENTNVLSALVYCN